jgi:MoaA/NifB/PqqE/SkfB family radical SAM enzyme
MSDVPMTIEILDKSLMMIFLQEECNFSCAHCLREEEPMWPGYKLSFEQLQQCLADCHYLESINWVHFSGGEPTLWTDGKHDLADLLLTISMAGFTPGFTSNGSFFVDYNRCYDFFKKYFDGSSMPLRVYFSIDTFHGNFNKDSGRAECLDNILKFKQEMPDAKRDLFNISVITVISKDEKSLLPDEMVSRYESLGVSFAFIPLYLKGKAKSFKHLCPDLSSDNPDDLGAYYRYHKKRTPKKPGEVYHIILIGDDYYFDDPWRKVARLGDLPDTILRTYSKSR